MLIPRLPEKLEVCVLAALEGLTAPAGSSITWTPAETADYIAAVLVERGHAVKGMTLGPDGVHTCVQLMFRTCDCGAPDPPPSEGGEA